jgi:hypothetical protein
MVLLTVLKALWARWKAIAHVVGEFQSRVVLSVFYFAVFGPFAVAARLLEDPLALRAGAGSRWSERPVAADVVLVARRQF